MPACWEQAGCVPWRERDGRPQVGLITNRNGDWIFPKGTIDPGDTSCEAATQETWEEAGWEGQVDPFSLIDVHRPKLDLDCRIRFFGLEVRREHESFPEPWRERCWVDPDDALHLLADTAMRTALQAWLDRHEALSEPVLFVCPNNLGTSLMLEYLWRTHVRDPHRYPVASAGLRPKSGLEVPPLVASVLESANLDPGPHRAQGLSRPLVRHAVHVFVSDDDTSRKLSKRYPELEDKLKVMPRLEQAPDADASVKQYRTYLKSLRHIVAEHCDHLP